MRAGRFISQLEFKPDRNLTQGAKACAKLLASISKERIRDELTKLLLTKKPSLGFLWYDQAQALAFFLPELLLCKGVMQGGWHSYDVFRHTLECLDRSSPTLRIRLSLLTHDLAKPETRTKDQDGYHFYGHAEKGAIKAKKILTRLRFPKDLTKEVSHLVYHHLFEERSAQSSEASIRRFIRRIGPELVEDLFEVRVGDAFGCGKGRGPGKDLQRLRSKVNGALRKKSPLSLHDLKVNGNDVMKTLNIPPSPQVGEILRDLLEWVIENPIRNEKNILLNQIIENHI